ncbi:MAG: hypothetical protein ABFR53_04595 [Actinomycetota bacterium]
MRSARRSVFLSIASVVVLVVAAVPVLAHGDDLDGTAATHQSASVHAFPGLPDLDPAGDANRSASLVRTDNGISWSMNTDSLTPGDVVTVWYVIFNHPGACGGSDAVEGPRCGEADLFVDDADVSVMWGAGTIVGGEGTAGWAGHLNIGELNSPHPAFDNGQGLDHPRGAEIHLVVRTHGPARPGYIGEQLHVFAAEGDVGIDLQAAAFRGEG